MDNLSIMIYITQKLPLEIVRDHINEFKLDLEAFERYKQNSKNILLEIKNKEDIIIEQLIDLLLQYDASLLHIHSFKHYKHNNTDLFWNWSRKKNTIVSYIYELFYDNILFIKHILSSYNQTSCYFCLSHKCRTCSLICDLNDGIGILKGHDLFDFDI